MSSCLEREGFILQRQFLSSRFTLTDIRERLVSSYHQRYIEVARASLSVQWTNNEVCTDSESDKGVQSGCCWIGLMDCTIRITIQFDGLDLDYQSGFSISIQIQKISIFHEEIKCSYCIILQQQSQDT